MYSSHLCPVSPPQVWERPVALEAELALTLKVLETVANSTLGDILEQPLSMLRHILAKLQACVSDGGARPCVWALSRERAPLSQAPPHTPPSSAHRSQLSPRQAPGPRATSATGCTGSRRPRQRCIAGKKKLMSGDNWEPSHWSH